MPDEQDQELVELLGSISPDQVVDLDAKAPDKPKPPRKTKKPKKAKEDPLPETEVIEEDLIPPPIPPEQEETKVIEKPEIAEPELVKATEIAEPPPASDLVPLEPDQQDDIGIKALLGKFGASVELIIANHAADREQIDEAIKFFEQEVRANPRRPAISAYVEGWSKLLATKAEVNTNATGVLDSIAKLLAAGKANDLIVNVNNVQKGDLDLEELLSQPKREDES